MMRCNTFARSALFAVLAAVIWLPWVFVAGPIVGVWNARALYLITVTALYIAGLAPHGPRQITIAVVSGLVACGLALAAHTTADLAIGLAVILGIARSAFLYRAVRVRAVTMEGALLIAGLLFARFLAGTALASTAFAVWGFLLVQSLFFLVPEVRPRGAAERQSDPFEEAYRRALALLEGRAWR